MERVQAGGEARKGKKKFGTEKGFKKDSFSLPVHVGEKKQKQNRQINDKRRKQLKMRIFFSLLAKQEPPETLITFAVDFSKKVAKYWKKLMIC